MTKRNLLQVELTGQQKKQLAKLARERDVTMSDVVRGWIESPPRTQRGDGSGGRTRREA